MAAQTIKSVARRRWTDESERRFSWYEPLQDPAAIGRAVRFVLGNAQLFLNTTSDATLLPAVLAAAAEARPSTPSDDEMRADQAEFAITPLFDGGRLERI